MLNLKNVKVMMVSLMMYLMVITSFGQEVKLNDITNRQFKTHVSKDIIYIVGDKIQLDTASLENGKFNTVIKVDRDVYIVDVKTINTSTEVKNIFIFLVIFLVLIFIYICTLKK